MDNRPIGIFDSGIGGLTVAKEVIKQLPNESIIYLGDTARVPYGTRSKEVVIKFALELVNFLLRRNVKCLVVACNTISAVAIDKIKKVSPVPVIGVVEPAVKKAVQVTKNGKVGVIGTIGTINSHEYDHALHKINPNIRVVSTACPLFVPMAEEGLNDHQATSLVAHDYLSGLIKMGVDTLILGCTHYVLLYDTIAQTVGKDVVLVDSAEPTTEKLKQLLKEKDLSSDNPNPKYKFYVTDAPQRVYKVAGRFFGGELEGKIEKVSLED